MTTVDDSNDWCIECSDEEKYGKDGLWQPNAADIVELYGKLKCGQLLELEWKSKGRRLPVETVTVIESTIEPVVTTAVEELPSIKDEQISVQAEFDFDMENEVNSSATSVIHKRSQASKQVQDRMASLDKIMSDMRRHQKMHQSSRIAPQQNTSGVEVSMPVMSDTNSVTNVLPADATEHTSCTPAVVATGDNANDSVNQAVG